MKNIAVYFNYTNFFALLIILLIALSLWLSFKKIKGRYYPNYYVILIIRSIIIILTIVLLLKPDVFLKYHKNLVPEVWIFIDKSMSINEQKNFTRESFISTLKSAEKILSKKGTYIRYFTFADSVEPNNVNIERIKFDGNITNISSVLKYLKKNSHRKNIAAAVLLSDGLYNTGESPEFFNADLNFPIFTIGIGDTVESVDPYVRRIVAPNAIKLGDTLSIRIFYSDDNAVGSKYILIFEDDGNLVDSLLLRSSTGKLLGEVNCKIYPRRTGIRTYTVILKVNSDKNPGNNVKKFLVNVKRNNKRIYLISSYAGFNSRFLKLILGKDNTEVFNFIDNGRLIPDNAKELLKQKPDLIVLNGYPGRNASSKVINFVKENMKHIPIILFINSKPDFEILNKEFLNGINFKAGKMHFVYPILGSTDHQIMKNLSLRYNISEAVKRLPPIGYSFRSIVLPYDFIYLFETQTIKEMPLIAIRRNNRLLLMIGEDFWRWYFMTLETEVEGFFEDLLETAVKFMMDFSHNRQVNLYLDKNLYYAGGKILIKGAIYKLDGNPINNGKFKIVILNQKDEVELAHELKFNGETYQGFLSLLNPGKYKIIGEGFLKGVSLGTDTASIEIMDIQIEKLKTGLDTNVLKEIAKRNKGSFYFLEDYSWVNELEPEIKTINKTRAIRIYNSLWVMMIIIGLFVVEWFIRKRTGYL